MNNISRKNTLGIHLKRFHKEFPDHYDFFPLTWLYPSEFYDINDYYVNKINKQKLRNEENEEIQIPAKPWKSKKTTDKQLSN